MKKKIGGLIVIIGFTLILWVSYNYVRNLHFTPSVNLEQQHHHYGIKDVGEVNLTEQDIKGLNDVNTTIENTTLLSTIVFFVIGLLLVFYGFKLNRAIFHNKERTSHNTH